MKLTTTNLFPLPCWAPALQRVPAPLLVLNEAFTKGERARKSLLARVIDLEPASAIAEDSLRRGA
jgi:hypothetical protein